MLPDPDAARVIDRVRNRAGHRTDAGFTETLCAEEPPGLEAIDEYLSLFRHIHNCWDPVGQVADAVMPRPWKFAIPRNRVRRHLETLDQRSVHIGFGDERIHSQSRIMA